MRLALAIAIVPMICGCEVGDRDIATKCGVDERQVKAAFAEVGQMKSSGSKKLGRCTFTKAGGQSKGAVLISYNQIPPASQ